MPRPLRVQFAGAIDHLMSRGDRREPVLMSAYPKGQRQKVELPRELRGCTPMTRQWIARRLAMGSASYVSHLLGQTTEHRTSTPSQSP